MTEPKAKWTILTYIAAHNNLDAMGQRSLAQILDVGSSPEVRLAVLFDGETRATRYIAGEPGQPALEEDLGDWDSGDGDALLDTVRWAFEHCPAEHYGLVLWSHGSGWRPEEIEQVAAQARGDKVVSTPEATERAGQPASMALFRSTLANILTKDTPTERAICFDDGTGHSLDTLELERIASEIQIIIGQPLDLLGMDACLMANLEVAYQLRHAVHYLVASEELVPGLSWPYDTIFQELCADPELTTKELAALVVKHYAQFYSTHVPGPGGGDVTKIALDLSHMSQMVDMVGRLAAVLNADMSNQGAALWTAQASSWRQETENGKRDPNKFRFHLWDLGSLAARLADNPNADVAAAARAIAAALSAAGSAVVAEAHRGPWFDGIGGVSVYLMPPGGGQRVATRPSPEYGRLAFAQDSGWLEMLEAYYKAVPRIR